MSKICTGCGTPMDDSAAVCPACGKPCQPSVPQQYDRSAARPQHYVDPPKSKAPKIIALTLAAVLVVGGATAAFFLLRNQGNDSNTADATANSTEAATQPVTQAPTVSPTVAPTQPATAAPTAAPVSRDGGWVNEDGYDRYYIDGELQTNTVVGSDDDGYVYVNSDGVKANGYCDAVTVDGVKWNVIEGNATRVDDEWSDCLHNALSYVGQCTDSSMSRGEKLRAAFEYIKRDDVFLEGVPDRDGEPYYDLNWPVVCANELFVGGMGDCFSYGAAFAFIAKGIGYENCYACTTGGHGWSEIDGKAYDPEWDAHHQEYNHFGVSPEDDCDVAYFTSLTEGVDWMYVRV